jgi:hypothetical protein
MLAHNLLINLTWQIVDLLRCPYSLSQYGHLTPSDPVAVWWLDQRLA